jgi:hypothetical protein
MALDCLYNSQMTLTGVSVAMFFLFLSRSQPLKQLSAERPHSKLFTVSSSIILAVVTSLVLFCDLILFHNIAIYVYQCDGSVRNPFIYTCVSRRSSSTIYTQVQPSTTTASNLSLNTDLMTKCV